MNVTGTARQTDGGWELTTADGQVVRLVGGSLDKRMDGKTVRVVGVKEDSFGGDFFGGPYNLIVQKVNVV